MTDFPVLESGHFLDHAAVAPISGAAETVLKNYAAEAAREHWSEVDWYRRLKEIRSATAKLIGAADPFEIAFVPNTSTGLATIAGGLDWQEGDRVLITDVEYPANRYPWEDLARHGVAMDEVEAHPDGRIPPEDVIAKITPRTRVVSLSYVQYSSGYCMDLKAIAEAVHAVGGYLCIDGIQAVGCRPVDVQATGIDFLAADGHKWMLGPEGAGFLYVKKELCPKIHPPVIGWLSVVNPSDYDQYELRFPQDARRFEPGTQNLAGTLAMGASIDLLNEVGPAEVHRLITERTNRFVQSLTAAGWRITSPRGHTANDPHAHDERSGILCFLPPEGQPDDKATLAAIRDRLKAQKIYIAVRAGKLRVSPHFYTPMEHVDQCVKALVNG